jgi:hypothetical protein
VDVGQTGALVGAHQGPVAIGLYTSHEEIGDPQGVKEVSRSDFLFTVVLSEVDEVKDVGVPRFEINAAKVPWLGQSFVISRDITSPGRKP